MGRGAGPHLRSPRLAQVGEHTSQGLAALPEDPPVDVGQLDRLQKPPHAAVDDEAARGAHSRHGQRSHDAEWQQRQRQVQTVGEDVAREALLAGGLGEHLHVPRPLRQQPLPVVLQRVLL